MVQQTTQIQQPPTSVGGMLPPEAFQMAAAYQLGAPTAVYRGRVKISVLLAKLFLIVMFIGSWGAIFVAMGFSPASWHVQAGPLQYGAMIVGIALLGLGVALIVRVITHAWSVPGWQVVACTDGLVVRKGKDEVKVVRWEQVDTVWLRGVEQYVNGILTGSYFRIIADLKDGTKVKLDERFVKIEDLALTVAYEVKRIQFPQVVTAYNAGSPIDFGPLTVSQVGISEYKKTLPWRQFAGIQVNKGWVDVLWIDDRTIGKFLVGPRKWMHIGVPDVPNLFVLLSLIDYAILYRNLCNGVK